MPGFTTYRTWFHMLFLTSFVIVIRFFLGQVFILLGRLLRLEFLGTKLALCGLAPFRGHCVCVHRYNKRFSSVYRTRTILIKQGAEVPMSLPLPTKLGDMW